MSKSVRTVGDLIKELERYPEDAGVRLTHSTGGMFVCQQVDITDLSQRVPEKNRLILHVQAVPRCPYAKFTDEQLRLYLARCVAMDLANIPEQNVESLLIHISMLAFTGLPDLRLVSRADLLSRVRSLNMSDESAVANIEETTKVGLSWQSLSG